MVDAQDYLGPSGEGASREASQPREQIDQTFMIWLFLLLLQKN